MADQNTPTNYLVVVDTSVGSTSAFNCAVRMIAALNKDIAAYTDKRNKLYIVHLNNLRTTLFTSAEKKEEKSRVQEKCCKAILTWFGRRASAFDVPFGLIGMFCESKSVYPEKISYLLDRLEIGGLFIGNPKIMVSANARANVFRINRKMGFLPDRGYLKERIHATDYSNTKSFDESTGYSSYEAKLETDFVEYQFVHEPIFDVFEKDTIIAEVSGQQIKKWDENRKLFDSKKEYLKEHELPFDANRARRDDDVNRVMRDDDINRVMRDDDVNRVMRDDDVHRVKREDDISRVRRDVHV